MVARLKEKGISELRNFKTRVLRQASLRRISQTDADELVDMVNEIEAYVIKMKEKPMKQEEKDPF
jgi:hypothetical protein